MTRDWIRRIYSESLSDGGSGSVDGGRAGTTAAATGVLVGFVMVAAI